MRAIELRIGNYLRDKVSKTLLKVVELSEGNNIATYVIDRSKFPLKKGWGLEPITLTEEILLKCGFEKQMAWTFSVDLIGGIKFVYYLGEKGWSLGNKNYSDFPNLKYLHQLQNLIYALTGEELTVNL